MLISEVDEQVYDYDWFALDKHGRVGHFATGGFATLPRSVAASSEDLALVADFFNSLPFVTEASLAPPAQKAAKSKSWRQQWLGPPMDAQAAAAHCFQDFVQMARRGLYSFDHAYALGFHWGTRPCPDYDRIAIPARPIHLTDLPREIQAVLTRTVLPDADFAQDDAVRVE